MANLPSFATLNQTRPDSEIAEESRFQGLGILGVNDKMRAQATLKGIEGKRLTYRRPDEAENN